MKYYLSKKVFFDTYNLNNHYIGWCIIGNYYINNEKILDNKLIEDNYIDVANICAVSVPEKNFISIEDDSVVFKKSENLRIIGNVETNGVKIENSMLLLIDYGSNEVDIEQKISEAMGNDFIDETLIKEKKDIRHVFFDNITNILYKQYIDDSDRIINSKKYIKITVGKLKVNLEGLES